MYTRAIAPVLTVKELIYCQCMGTALKIASSYSSDKELVEKSLNHANGT